jgi:membrane protein
MSELRRDPVGVSKDAVKGFQKTDGTGLAAEAAYRLVFALPALVIFFASVSGLTAQYTGVDVFQSLLDRAEEALPEEAFETLELVFDAVEEQSGFGVLSIGLVIALWSGSNAMAAIVKAINRAFGLEDQRGMIRQRLVALGLTIGLSLLIITSFILFIFGQQIGEALAETLGYGDVFTTVLNIVRWPLILAFFMAALAILYKVGPAEPMPLRTTFPGAVTATVLWLAATWGFSLYLTFADPGSAYGVLGGILILLLFLYISSIVIIVGAEVNAVLRSRYEGALARLERVEHPAGVLPGAIEISQPAMGSRAATWIVLGLLFVGAVIGSLRKRPESEA